MSIRAVLFDLGNTLLEYSLQGRWREFLCQRLEEMCSLICDTLEHPALAPAEFAASVGEVIGGESARAVEQSGRSWHFRRRLREGLAKVGLCAADDCLERLTDVFHEPIRACTKPYPDTAEVLNDLRLRELLLAIISNSPWDTPARLLRGDLQHWGFGDLFDAFICSGEAPWRKPNPSFMLAAAEVLGIAAGDCLVVGDSLESDIGGARAAGMASVWVNPSGSPAPRDAPQPRWVARSIARVAEILGAREQPGNRRRP